MAEAKVERPSNMDTKGRFWFVAERDLDLIITEKVAERDQQGRVSKEGVSFRFDRGILSTDAEGAKFLAKHPNCAESAPLDRRFSPASSDDLTVILRLEEQAIPRKQWHRRIQMLRDALSTKTNLTGE